MNTEAASGTLHRCGPWTVPQAAGSRAAAESAMSDRQRVRVAVVGAGLISQAMHLPHLRSAGAIASSSVALVDPSRHGARAPRRPLRRFTASLRSIITKLFEADPPGRRHRGLAQRVTHSEIVLGRAGARNPRVRREAAVQSRSRDADAIIAARERGRPRRPGRLQQPLRPGVRAAGSTSCRARARRGCAMSTSSSTTRSSIPTFGPDDLVRSADVPWSRSSRRPRVPRRRARSRLAVGPGDSRNDVTPSPVASSAPSSTRSTSCTACSEKMGEPLPAPVIDATGGWPARGLAGYGTPRERRPLGQRLDPAARCASTRRGSPSFSRTRIALAFPSPWLVRLPTLYTEQATAPAAASTGLPVLPGGLPRELVHFHGCVAGGAGCRTPPEQGAAGHPGADRDVPTRRGTFPYERLQIRHDARPSG